MAKPNLLLCFDAFGTLFRPVRPIAQQYAQVARQCGLAGFTDEELSQSFRSAFKNESKKNPNYGKATGLGATQWWTNVIHNTFTPLIKTDQPLPKELAPTLLHRFASSEAYEPQRNLVSAFRSLKLQKPKRRFDSIIVGVVTNSDNRVPGILSSLGLAVSPLRYGSGQDMNAYLSEQFDVDFHCMSYDVGVEKPDKLMFDAAEKMLERIIAARNSKGENLPGSSWQKMYVGDEYSKDVLGSKDAGWNPVLLDQDSQSPDLHLIEDSGAETLDELWNEHPVVGTRSMEGLAAWLTGDTVNA